MNIINGKRSIRIRYWFVCSKIERSYCNIQAQDEQNFVKWDRKDHIAPKELMKRLNAYQTLDISLYGRVTQYLARNPGRIFLQQFQNWLSAQTRL